MRPRVLVTGAAGVVGKGIAPALAGRFDVVGLDRPTPAAKDRSMLRADIRNWRALRAALASVAPLDAVVHLAFAPPVDIPAEDRATREFEVTVLGMWNVLTEAHARGARRFVFASSLNVYGDLTADRPHVEDDDMFTTNTRDVAEPYGLAKLLAERTLGYFCRSKGCTGVALRLDAVHSPGVMERRGIHVDDIASAVVAALEATDAPAFEVFNLVADPARHGAPNERIRQRLGWEPHHVFEHRPELENWAGGDVEPLGPASA